MLPIQIVDKGAIKFILSGAHIMCPGLTSPGAFLDMECEEGAAVQVKKFQASSRLKVIRDHIYSVSNDIMLSNHLKSRRHLKVTR